MNKLILSLLILAMLSCNNEPSHYDGELHGIQYAYIYKKGEIPILYIKNYDVYSLEQIIEFSYCLSLNNDFEGIRIESHWYFISAIWYDEPMYNKVLFGISLESEGISGIDNKTDFERRISHVLYRTRKGEWVKLNKGKYQEIYECE